MMQQDRNVEVAREAFAAFTARDLGRLGQTLADDVSWHTPGANVLAGDYYGRTAVIGCTRRPGGLRPVLGTLTPPGQPTVCRAPIRAAHAWISSPLNLMGVSWSVAKCRVLRPASSGLSSLGRGVFRRRA